MEARNKGKLPYGHLLESFLLHLTLLTEKLLVWPQFLCSCKSIQAPRQGRYPKVLAGIGLTIARRIGSCSSHLSRTPLIWFQVKWKVYAWVISCGCETTGHTHNIWPQNTREYPMSNTTIAACTINKMWSHKMLPSWNASSWAHLTLKIILAILFELFSAQRR